VAEHELWREPSVKRFPVRNLRGLLESRTELTSLLVDQWIAGSGHVSRGITKADRAWSCFLDWLKEADKRGSSLTAPTDKHLFERVMRQRFGRPDGTYSLGIASSYVEPKLAPKPKKTAGRKSKIDEQLATKRKGGKR
jgi:hypothetical protein